MIVTSTLITTRRSTILATDCPQQLTFWERKRQQAIVDCAGGRVVTAAGLLPCWLLPGAVHARCGVVVTLREEAAGVLPEATLLPRK